jgi:transposase
LIQEAEEIARAAEQAPVVHDATVPGDTKGKPKRRPLPDHLPRHKTVLPAPEACTACGGRLKLVGEDVTEELECVPGRFVVNRIIRPRLACACCETFHQAALPSRSIERGRPDPDLLAHVLVGKYADHLPLYRQSQIFARDRVELDRSTARPWPVGLGMIAPSVPVPTRRSGFGSGLTILLSSSFPTVTAMRPKSSFVQNPYSVSKAMTADTRDTTSRRP